MKFILKILNKKLFVLCFIDAFIVYLSNYLIPVASSIFTKQPFTLEKLKYLMISIICLKSISLYLIHVWLVHICRFELKYSKDIQLGYFNRLLKMNPFKLSQIHNGYLKMQIDVTANEAMSLMDFVFQSLNGFRNFYGIFSSRSVSSRYKCVFCMLVSYTYYSNF